MPIVPVKNTEVLGVVCPTLEELKSRPCSLEELQAAIVQLAEINNLNAHSVQDIQNDLNKRFGNV